MRVAGSPLDASGPRLDMGGMLFWEQPHCEVFRTMLCHPKLVPYLTELCGLGYRLDHQPMVIAQALQPESTHSVIKWSTLSDLKLS